MLIDKTTAPGDPQDRARVLALLPTLDARYHGLRDLLRDAARGQALTAWDLDLALADLDAVLVIMRGPGGADETETAP